MLFGRTRTNKIVLIDGEGRFLGTPKETDGGSTTLMEYTPATSGKYGVVVTTHTPGGTGDYHVVVRRQ